MKGLQITLSLTAPTREEISAMTVRAQLNWGLVLEFFEFSQDKNGNWICWYKVPYTIYVEKVGINGKA